MQVNRLVTQDPQSSADWENDWTEFLGTNDTITARQWGISPLNNTTPETPSLANSTTSKVRVSGGINGRIYYLVEFITLLSGQTMDQTIVIRFENNV